MRDHYELIVIGGGPAGLSAAISAKNNGLSQILIVERDVELGGILNQCIHNGFGLHYFGEELTGPEYAWRLRDQMNTMDIDVVTDTMVLSFEKQGPVYQLTLMSAKDGYRSLRTDSIILAMGCRERTRGAIQIPGARGAGILTAGTAQRYVNMEGYMVGRRVIILGSGDIGLIMARRMTLEGAEVLACVEIMPHSGGLNRNIVQCLDDYDIPLLLSHTITHIEGKDRVSRVTVQKVDSSLVPISGTEQFFDVDSVLLSVGLIPENELSRAGGVAIDPKTGGPVVYENRETSLPGVFASGNVLHVHDLVDFVSEESELAGRYAARYVQQDPDKRTRSEEQVLDMVPKAGISYAVPHKVRPQGVDDFVEVFFRVTEPHKTPKRIVFKDGEQTIAAFRRPYMAPGEMEHVRIPKKLLERVTGSQLVITVDD